MSFLIAVTFTNSLAKLTTAEQSLVKQTAFEFQMNPAAPGFSFEAFSFYTRNRSICESAGED